MKKGFTLIELLIVMVVVAVLVTLAASKYKIAMEKGRGLEGIHNAQALSDALNAFYIQDGNIYHPNHSQSARDAAGVTKDRHFTCTIRGEQTDSRDVICERITGRYTIWVFNKEGETTSVGCSGDERYCKALGATKLTGTNLWSF